MSSPDTVAMKTIKFKSFSSGSCGNCYFIGIFHENGKCECGVLVDAGISPRRLKKEMAADGLDYSSFDGILVTHDHFDHIRSLGSYCKHIRKPVWVTEKLGNAMESHHITGEYFHECRHTLNEGWNEIVPGRISARYFAVPHDAAQTLGYAIVLDGYRFVIMTDMGEVPKEAMDLAKQADTVVIESNYDPEMLRNGPYPKELQDRIRSSHGHLSNCQCAAAIAEFAHEGLRNVFLCHLSEHNNTPALAHDCSRPVLEASVRLVPLPRQSASPLFLLGNQ